VTRPTPYKRDWFAFAGDARFAALLFVLLSAIFLGDALLSGGAYLLRDVLTFHHPWQTAVKEAVQAGRLPLWNHHTYCGIPLLANLQSGVFYPPHWLGWFLPFDQALTLEMVLHLALAGFLMHRFLRRVGAGAPGAILGGIGFAYGSWTISYLEFPMKLGSAVWLPLLWCGVWDAMHGSARRGLAWSALAISLSLFAGYPQLVFFQLLSAGLLALTLLPHVLGDPLAKPKDKIGRMAVFPLAVLLAVAIAGAQILPAREMAALSSKVTGYSPEVAMSRSLPPHGLLGMFDPFFLGYPGFDRFWGGDVAEYCFAALYIGALAIPLCFAAGNGALLSLRDLWSGRKRRRRLTAKRQAPIASDPALLPLAGGIGLFLFLVLGGLGAAALSLGKHTPAYSFLLEMVPGFDQMRWPATAEFLWTAHLSALAGIGLDAAFRRRKTPGQLPKWILALGGALLLVALLGKGPLSPSLRWIQTLGAFPDQLAAYDSMQTKWLDALLLRGAMVLVAGAIGILLSRRSALVAALWVIITALDLFVAARSLEMPLARGFYDRVPTSLAELGDTLQGHRIFTPRSTDQLGNFLYGSRNPVSFDWAKQAMLCNANIPAGIFQAQGCEPLSPRRHEAFVQAFESESTPWEIKERVFDFWDAALLITADGVSPREMPRLTNAQHGVVTSRHEPRLARATLLSGWETPGQPQEVLARLFAPNHDPRALTLLEAAPGEGAPSPSDRAPEAGGEPLPVIYEQGQIRVAWQMGRAGMLRVLESWAPGWHAKVNGERVPIHRADFLFMAVPVPDAPCEVVLTYQPASFRNGVILSIVGLVGLVFCFAGGGGPQSFPEPPAPGPRTKTNVSAQATPQTRAKGNANTLQPNGNVQRDKGNVSTR
jgi:hypothetical protein